MKKRTFTLLGLILIITSLGVYSYFSNETTIDNNDKPKVAATIFPVYDLVQQIAGEQIEVVQILPTGQSPHTFDPSPSTMIALQNAQRIFSIGHGLDDWAVDFVENGGSKEIVLDENIKLMAFEQDHKDDHNVEHEDDDNNHEGDHEHTGVDPHYWLHPEYAKEMIITIAQELSVLQPENAELFEQRSQEYIDVLNDHIEDWKEQLYSVHSVAFVTMHDSFGYFALFGGLNLVDSYEALPGREPTPSTIVDLTRQVEEHTVKAIFSEPQLSIASIKTFAQDNGIVISILDPIGGQENRTSYIELIGYNVNSLVKALQ